MLLLQQTFPLLFDIVSIVEGDQLPEALTAFIIDLLEKAKSEIHSAEMDQYQMLCNWMYTETVTGCVLCCATGCVQK